MVDHCHADVPQSYKWCIAGWRLFWQLTGVLLGDNVLYTENMTNMKIKSNTSEILQHLYNTRMHRMKLAACSNKYNQIQNNKMVKTNTNHDSYMTETKTEILTVTWIYTDLATLTAIFLNKHGSLGPGPFSLHSMDHWLCLTHKSPKTWDYS